MSDKFSEFNAAVRMREAMRAVVRDVLNTMYPPAKYASCESVDLSTRRATCRYPGETEMFSVPYGGLAPLVGSTVRIAGSPGARYVDEVFNRPMNGESPLAALKRVGIVSEQSDVGSVVGTAEIQNGSVTGAKIASNTITAGNIGTNAVGQSELAADAVTSAHIADNAVTSAHIATNTITQGDIANDAVGSGELIANSVGTSEIASGVFVDFGEGSAASPSISFSSDTNTGFYNDVNDGVVCTVNGTARHFFLNNGMFITAPSGNSTSCQINGLGQLTKFTSTERYKLNITPLSDDVLCEIGDRIEAVTYQSNPDHSVDDPDMVFLGAIAERVEELLTDDQKDWLVTYNNEGQCESLKYELFGLVSIAMSRRNTARLDALEARLAALESH